MRWVVLLLCFAGCAHTKPDSRAAEFESIAELNKALRATDDRAALARLEWDLARALERAGLLNLAFIYTTAVAKFEQHPHRAEALATLLRLQERRHDDLLIPALFNHFALTAPLMLSEQDAARVAYSARASPSAKAISKRPCPSARRSRRRARPSNDRSTCGRSRWQT